MHVSRRKESELTQEDAQTKSTAGAFETSRLISSESNQSNEYLTYLNLDWSEKGTGAEVRNSQMM